MAQAQIHIHTRQSDRVIAEALPRRFECGHWTSALQGNHWPAQKLSLAASVLSGTTSVPTSRHVSDRVVLHA